MLCTSELHAAGGQLRRLSLACELLTQPKLLFLDEPTSGLDAAAAFHVVRCCVALSTLQLPCFR